MAGDDESTTWRDDLAAEDTFAMLDRTLAAAAVEEIDLPHIVVCTDPETGAACFSGPYRDGLEALAMAEYDAERDRLAGGDPMRYSVAALLPAEVVRDA